MIAGYNFKKDRIEEARKISFLISTTDRFSMFRFYNRVEKILNFLQKGDLIGYYSSLAKREEFTECEYLLRTILSYVSGGDRDTYIFENIIEEFYFWIFVKEEINLFFGLNN